MIGSDGTVFVGSAAGNVFALQWSTGTLLWNYMPAGGVVAPPAYENGVLWVGALDGGLYSINATNGDLIRQNLVSGAAIRASPVISADGQTIFVASDDGCVRKVPNSFCFFNTTRPVVASPSLSADGSVLYVASSDWNVYAITAAERGMFLWKRTTGGALTSSVVVGPHGLVFVAGGDGHLLALNASTGTIVWDKAPPSGSHYLAPALSSDGRTLYSASSKSQITTLDASSGDVKWAVSLINRLNGGVPADLSTAPFVDMWGNMMIGAQYNNTLVTSRGQIGWNFGAPGATAAVWALGAGGTVLRVSGSTLQALH